MYKIEDLVVNIFNDISNLKADSRKQLLDALSTQVCPNCGGMKFFNDGERSEKACTSCGLIQNNGDSKFVAGFDESAQMSPSSELSYGRSLGDTLYGTDVFKVLSKVTAGVKFNTKTKRLEVDKDLTKDMKAGVQAYLKKNIGLRARFIRIYTSTCDPPNIKKALSFGEELCREFGLFGEDAVDFRNYYGKLLRKVASLAMHMKQEGETFEARRLALACFVYVWQLLEKQHGLRDKIKYQRYFPDWSSRYRRGLKIVGIKKYQVRKEVWTFVLHALRVHVPTAVAKNGRTTQPVKKDLAEPEAPLAPLAT